MRLVLKMDFMRRIERRVRYASAPCMWLFLSLCRDPRETNSGFRVPPGTPRARVGLKCDPRRAGFTSLPNSKLTPQQSAHERVTRRGGRPRWWAATQLPPVRLQYCGLR